jgi:hypothetical protein
MIERAVGDVRFTGDSSLLFQSTIRRLELRFTASLRPLQAEVD